MMTNEVVRESATRPEFEPYLSALGFLGAVLGPRTEIVLHDISDLTHSIIALVNGHISGRSLGGPATDLVLQILQNREYLEHDYLANYLAESRTGGHFRSSTFFIRDSAGEVMGMLCLNTDDGPLTQARDLLTLLTSTNGFLKGTTDDPRAPVELDTAKPVVAERLSTNVAELTLGSVTRIIQGQGIDALRMTQDEKLAAVRDLEQAGVFLLKGAVTHTAVALHVSEPTVYRYVKQARSRR